jgi:hypothetical protein
MTATNRLTTNDLLDLADQIASMANLAKDSCQQSAENALVECLAHIWNAAKVTAIDEAMDRRDRAREGVGDG